MRRFALCFCIALFFSLGGFAQTMPYTDQVFLPEIKTVELYNTKKAASFPLIELNSGEQLLLGFDDLQGGSRNFYYTIEHCDENWTATNISPAEYLQSFTEDQIRDYSYSSSTIQNTPTTSLNFRTIISGQKYPAIMY